MTKTFRGSDKVREMGLKWKRKTKSKCGCIECSTSHRQHVHAKRKILITKALQKLQSRVPFLQSEKCAQINRAIETTRALLMDTVRRVDTRFDVSEFETKLRALTNDSIRLTSQGITSRLRFLSGIAHDTHMHVKCTCEGVIHIAAALKLAEKRKYQIG